MKNFTYNYTCNYENVRNLKCNNKKEKEERNRTVRNIESFIKNLGASKMKHISIRYIGNIVKISIRIYGIIDQLNIEISIFFLFKFIIRNLFNDYL